jgi:hypothetical protein
MMEAVSFSETTVLSRAARGNIPEDAILHSHCREKIKSYLARLIDIRPTFQASACPIAVHIRSITAELTYPAGTFCRMFVKCLSYVGDFSEFSSAGFCVSLNNSVCHSTIFKNVSLWGVNCCKKGAIDQRRDE